MARVGIAIYPMVAFIALGVGYQYRLERIERASRQRILETGYSLLKDIGGEEPGYGLYSYALAVNDSGRSTKFLNDVFRAIRPVEDTAAHRSQTNIFYIPLKKNIEAEEMIKRLIDNNELAASIATHGNFFDYNVSGTAGSYLRSAS